MPDFLAVFGMCICGVVQDVEIQKMQSELKEAPALMSEGHMRAAHVRERTLGEQSGESTECAKAGQAKQLQSDLQKIKTDLAKANEMLGSF